MVDAHLSILSPINPAKNTIPMPHEICLCFLIRCTFIIAKPTIHPINAVLESVSIIAIIRNTTIALLMITFLFMITNSLMFFNFSLQNNITAGKNAIKKYP